MILGPDGKPITSIENSLTQEEKDKFAYITNSPDVGLMRVLFDGVVAAALCSFRENGDGTHDVVPMAVLVDDALFKRFTPPGDFEEVTDP